MDDRKLLLWQYESFSENNKLVMLDQPATLQFDASIPPKVSSYRNRKNAIGFSFRYYSTEMVQGRGIRLLSLNGVAPTRETIQDGIYPIASEFYAITVAPIGPSALHGTNPRLADLLDRILSA